jgi:hypothetical protein
LSLIDVGHGGAVLHRVQAHSGSVQALSLAPLYEEEEEGSSLSSYLQDSAGCGSAQKVPGPVGLEAAAQTAMGEAAQTPDSVSMCGVGGEDRPLAAPDGLVLGVPHPYPSSDVGSDPCPKALLVVTSGEDGTVKVWSYGSWGAPDSEATRTEVVVAAPTSPSDTQALLTQPPLLVRPAVCIYIYVRVCIHLDAF